MRLSGSSSVSSPGFGGIWTVGDRRAKLLAMFFSSRSKTRLPSAADALPGRDQAITAAAPHAVNGHRTAPPWPEGLQEAMFGLGCFWGAERAFWQTPGVYSTQVGYSAGVTKNPTYQEVCSGRTGHNEVVRVVFDPQAVSFAALVSLFFESHDPTQGMRQGNDAGTQYRSGIYTYDAEQVRVAEAARAEFEPRLKAAGYGPITTEIVATSPFYYAEDYHQQYLHKNPGGYCGLGGTGVKCGTSAFEAG